MLKVGSCNSCEFYSSCQTTHLRLPSALVAQYIIMNSEPLISIFWCIPMFWVLERIRKVFYFDVSVSSPVKGIIVPDVIFLGLLVYNNTIEVIVYYLICGKILFSSAGIRTQIFRLQVLCSYQLSYGEERDSFFTSPYKRISMKFIIFNTCKWYTGLWKMNLVLSVASLVKAPDRKSKDLGSDFNEARKNFFTDYKIYNIIL